MYRRYGWALKEFIANPADQSLLSDVWKTLAPEAGFRIGEVSSMWYSRRSRSDCEAWELRRLHNPPLALVEILPDSLPPDEKARILLGAEQRLADLSSGGQT